MFNKLNRTHVILLLAAFPLVQLLFLWNVLPLPPVGQHVWRQVTGLAFARNYAFEHAPFFLPRQDIRVGLADNGIVYHEFPLIYWIVGKLYQIFGFHFEIGRALAFCVNIIGVPGSYVLARQLDYSKRRSLAFALFYCFSPLFFYYTTTLLPDLTALNFFICGVALVLYANRESMKTLAYFAGVLLIALAVLTKPSWALYGLPLLAVFFRKFWTAKRLPSFKELIHPALAGVIILGLFLWQYLYSRDLLAASPLERAIHAQLKVAERPQGWNDLWRNLSAGIGNWFMEINVGWGAILLFLTGAWTALRTGMNGTFSRLFWSLYLLSFCIYGYFFVMRFGDHDYYLTASLPLAAALSSRGFEVWFTRNRLWKTLALILALLYPLASYMRIEGRWFGSRQVPRALLEEAQGFEQVIPAEDRVLVVGDKTPLTYLYYINRKGITYLSVLDSSFPETLEKGDFRWLLIDKKYVATPPVQVLQKFTLVPVKQIDTLELYKLEPVGQ
ncbi:MAG TPA: glycosyltransferase family 39 protein [Oligoflexus sp.]|uniref:ArnT family glycosyltransferase n=1 Tax=Oligoflexus sp. TaxID=1971216 RepID=UPI002D7F89D5|nr:glycosyltransferase family 39 protein [Oligoflexus sp.]HET9241542.1 glycosyltransferase family 39 protein [Oligoflexus sp.]